MSNLIVIPGAGSGEGKPLTARSARALCGARSALIVLALLTSSAGHASASSFLTSASQLAPNDTALNLATAPVNGGAPATVGSTYSASSISFTVLNTTSNNKITFSGAANGYEIDQVGANYGASAFANGTLLLGAGGFQGPAGGRVTLTFAQPVSQFGVNIEDFNTGPYSLFMNAEDAAGNSVGFGYSGNDASLTGNDPSSLSFAGFAVTGDTIKSVTFDDGTDNLLFGNLEYLNAGTPAGQAPNPAPEPSTMAFFGLGLLITSLTTRRLVAGKRATTDRIKGN